jgi:hypothetical protein
MARRASSSAHPIWIVAAALLTVVAVAGGYAIYGRVSDPFRTVSPLPVHDYLQNSNSLRGNVYKVEATIAKPIEWSPTAGRLFSVEVGEEVLPILVSPQFNHLNIERGQRYRFKLEVGDKGVLRAQDVRKA